MSGLVRRAGRGVRADGTGVTWSVAEGRRGRRWREVVVRDGAVVHSLLYETGPDRRFAHLELSTETGLLTLHPEGDGTLHGNAVVDEGVEHVLGIPWDSDAVLLVEGSTVAAAAAAHLLGTETGERAAIMVHPDLSLESLVVREVLAEVSAEGVPVIEGGRDWPLELD